jgi:hydrogenase-4 membrane subunit HyfE
MTAVLWAALGLGVATVLVRRRSVAIGLLALQSLLVSATALALAPGRSEEFFAAALVLLVKAILITALLGLAVSRTREVRPVRAGIDPLLRLGLTLAGVLALNVLIPPVAGLDPTLQRTSLGILAAGIATVVLRRATILHLVGLLVAENGLALAAVSIHGGLPVLIELGALFDLTLLISVAIAFHDRIFMLLGTGDSALLRELHD